MEIHMNVALKETRQALLTTTTFSFSFPSPHRLPVTIKQATRINGKRDEHEGSFDFLPLVCSQIAYAVSKTPPVPRSDRDQDAI
jgi:hypothetical protein